MFIGKVASKTYAAAIAAEQNLLCRHGDFGIDNLNVKSIYICVNEI